LNLIITAGERSCSAHSLSVSYFSAEIELIYRVKKSNNKDGQRRNPYGADGHYFKHITLHRLHRKLSAIPKNAPVSNSLRREYELLRTEASQYLKALCSAQYNELHRCRLPVEIKKLAGLWCSFAVNCGSETEPVQTKLHKDQNSLFWRKVAYIRLEIFKRRELFYGSWRLF
jgi:hypothetical protein